MIFFVMAHQWPKNVCIILLIAILTPLSSVRAEDLATEHYQLSIQGLCKNSENLCGPFCAAIALDYFDKPRPFDEINRELIRSNDGLVTFNELSLFLKGSGLCVKGFKGTLTELRDKKLLIIPVGQKGEDNTNLNKRFHFVVVQYSLQQNLWCYLDGLESERIIHLTEDQLESIWAGVALVITQSE